MDSNLSKPVNIMTSKLLFLTLILLFSSNKNVLGWFLQIISKEYNLSRSANILSRNHTTSSLWLRKDAQYLLLTLWLEVQKQPFPGVLQNNFLKNFAIFTRKHLCWSLFLIKLQTSRSATFVSSEDIQGVVQGHLNSHINDLN